MTPYMQTGHVTLYVGDALDVLRQLPDESVDCAVTSPPYWGLRAYGTAPQVWGGDPACAHEWRETDEYHNRGDSTAGAKQKSNAGAVMERGVVRYGTCTACGAWRGDYGLEPTPDLYVEHTVAIFREVRRVLRKHATLWLNLGDSYATGGRGGGAEGSKQQTNDGLKPKDMVGIPWMVAFALRADGWYLRSDIVWSKPNPMPESVTDRPTKSHEYVFLLAKSERYFFDMEAVRESFASSPSDLRKMAEQQDRIGGKHKTLVDPLSMASAATNIGRKRGVGNAQAAAAALTIVEPDEAAAPTFPGIGPQHGTVRQRGEEYEPMAVNAGRNIRSVWTIATQPYPEAHFATFPRELPERAIKAGCPADGIVLDPFAGSGTTLAVARDLGRRSIGIELSAEYARLIEKRCAQEALPLVVGE